MYPIMTHVFFAHSIKFLQFLIEDMFLFKRLVRLVQQQRRASIFDRIMCLLLYLFLENVPGKKT